MSKNVWKKVSIIRDDGTRVEGIAPIIISASRSTDIPGCYGDWFMNRLRRGYTAWINPFNGTKHFVSFEKVRCIVFWTKNPMPFIKYIDHIHDMGIGVMFQVTVNNYEQEELERNIPQLRNRISSFQLLSEKLGKEKVLWRFDPLILTKSIGCSELIDKIASVGNHLHHYTSRLTISFLTHYKKVVRNLSANGINPIIFSDEQKCEVASGIQQLNMKWNLDTVSCAEALELSQFGIRHGSCIDPYLITHCFRNDKYIRELTGISDVPDLFGPQHYSLRSVIDHGQRPQCGCMVSKDIGMYNTCRHGCVYCYANTSPVKVMYSKPEDDTSELITLK
jgi:DNA repair photolyase